MYSQIEQIKTTTKLPGYLFVLTGITDINEKIFLGCHKEDYEFTNSMLNVVGLEVLCLKEPPCKSKALFILNELHELNSTIQMENYYQCSVIYVKNTVFGQNPLKKVRCFLAEHPQGIIVINENSTVSKKQFCISINQKNRYYDRLQQHILRFGNTYGIKKFPIH